MKNIEQVILSQFANSATIVALINNMNAHFRQDANFDAFYNQIWNINTAQGYGLDVWGRIVGVTRVLAVSTTPYLSFKEAGNGALGGGFNQAPFYSGHTATSNYSLSDPDFRSLILAKAAANITDGSIPSINALLMTVFGASGQCWCTDGQNMTMTYTFQFALTPVQYAIITQSGVFARPPGVNATIVQH